MTENDSVLIVEHLLQQKAFPLKLRIVSGREGLSNEIKVRYVQKPGLALTGFTDYLVPYRIQVFGKTEIAYLRNMDPDDQRKAMQEFFRACPIACCIVTRGLETPESMTEACEEASVPLLLTEIPTPDAIANLTAWLARHFAEVDSLHGDLLDVFGVGIMLSGDSGVGKSECALDLVLRGHRLVADDLVEIHKQSPTAVYGRSPDMTKYHMEIRGLGVLNIKELFGVSAVRDRKKLQLVITFVEWEESVEYDRIGLDEDTTEIMGVELPHIILPVRPGRNLTAIVEVAARNYLLKLEGYNSAKAFQNRLLEEISRQSDEEVPGEELE